LACIRELLDSSNGEGSFWLKVRGEEKGSSLLDEKSMEGGQSFPEFSEIALKAASMKILAHKWSHLWELKDIKNIQG